MPSQGIGVDDASAFRDTIMPLLDHAYNFARYLSRDADAAQDIVQDAFLRAHRGFGGFRGGDARAWLFTIVRNCYHAWLSERSRKSRLAGKVRDEIGGEASAEFELASEADTPEAALLRKTEAEAVHRILRAMPRRLREIIILREIEDMSYSEIAQVTSLPIGTVMSRLSRARQRFGESWHSHAGSDSLARLS